MSQDVKKSSSKGWIAVIAGVVFGVVFLGLLLLSVKNDARDVQNYAKTWSGDKGSVTMDHEHMNHQMDDKGSATMNHQMSDEEMASMPHYSH